jgi:pimeloyl-ACP methyl ester carboxylesterase
MKKLLFISLLFWFSTLPIDASAKSYLQPFHAADTTQNSNYSQQKLIIRNKSTKIGGTFTYPKNQLSKQLVIMISGSGAQDRDETMTPISDFKPFALLADSLTTSGMATYRYDDRGVGQSTGSFQDATLDTLASDVEAIIDYFENSRDHSFSEITLLGHSQGGIVGGKVAAQNNNVDKLILMASPGVPLKRLLRYQVKKQFSQAAIDSILVNREIEAREQMMQAIRTDSDMVQAKQTYQKRFAAIQRSAGADSSYAAMIATQQATQLSTIYGTPQMQSLLFYDPTEDLHTLNIPVLVLLGSKDTQVPVSINKSPIRQALESADTPFQMEIFEQANHPFQKAQTGQASEYGTLPNKFVEGFTSTISQWIK